MGRRCEGLKMTVSASAEAAIRPLPARPLIRAGRGQKIDEG